MGASRTLAPTEPTRRWRAAGARHDAPLPVPLRRARPPNRRRLPRCSPSCPRDLLVARPAPARRRLAVVHVLKTADRGETHRVVQVAVPCPRRISWFRAVRLAAGASELHDPVGLPGAAAIRGECLLPAGRPRPEVGPDVPDPDRFPL